MKKLALLLTLTFPLISILTEEMYPYSSVSMFSFVVDEIYQFEVLDASNHSQLERFDKLKISNCCDPKVSSWGRMGYGALHRDSLLSPRDRRPYGDPPNMELVNDYILAHMQRGERLKLILNKTMVEDQKVVSRVIETWELER